jgi:hypothetical protein
MYWSESSGRIELQITKSQADSCSHPGQCDQDVADLRLNPAIRRQLQKLSPALVAECLKEYGAWDAVELSDHDQNLDRLLWIACCDIAEGNN